MSETKGLMAFWADFEPADVEELRRWHNCEHMLERVSIPGFVHGRRYRGNDEAQTFLMYYETETAAVLGSKAYQQALNTPTAWTQSALRLFRNPARNIYSLLAACGVKHERAAPFLATIRFNHRADGNDVLQTYRESVLPALADLPSVERARLYMIDEAISGIMTAERQIYGGGPGQQKYLLFVELADEISAYEPAELPGMVSGLGPGHRDIFSEVGWLDFWLEGHP